MEVDPTTVTLVSSLLIIIAMLMGLMIQILRRLDGNTEQTTANTIAINALGKQLNAAILINRH